MSPVAVRLAGAAMLLDPHGALFWPAERLLAVADLHFEKGSSAARHGSLLPPWDTHATLDRLAGLIRRHAPRCVVAVGDSFHDPHASGRLQHGDVARMRAITRAVERFVWVQGNHDPRPPEAVGGEWHAVLQAGPLLFRHQAARASRNGWTCGGEVSGHYHPKAHVAVRGAVVTRPCFVSDGRRLILPALGAYTGGLDVRSAAISRFFPNGGKMFLLGRDRLFVFPLTHDVTASATIAPSPDALGFV